jgi:hypothetical protein
MLVGELIKKQILSFQRTRAESEISLPFKKKAKFRIPLSAG